MTMPKISQKRPVNDWTAREVLDAKAVDPEGSATCGFCGTKIRWIHVLEHDDYVGTVPAGCCCALKYCNEYDAAGAEKEVRALAARRQKFADLRRWKPSRKNAENLVRNVRLADGAKVRVTIFRQMGRYKLSFAETGGEVNYPRDSFGSQVEAALAAFDLLEEWRKAEADEDDTE